MSNVQPLLIDTQVRDPDLLQRLDQAGSFMRDIVYKQCAEEQARRDALSAMPAMQRRRVATRRDLEEKGATSRDSLSHIHSVLALCSLPYQQQGIAIREWNRTQGRMKLSITAGKLTDPTNGDWVDMPLPYGSRARLLLLHVCSEAIRNSSPVIEVEDSLSAFIRAMGFPVTGGKHGTLTTFKQQINALAACSMRIGVWDGNNRSRTINTQPFTSLSMEMFTAAPNQRVLWPSTLSLSREFFDTLSSHALPINIHAARAFANSPRKLDLLFWLGYRLHSLKSKVAIPWDKLSEQWGSNYSRFANFKRDFAKEIAEIKEVFPKLPVVLTETGCTISPGSPEVIALPRKPLK